MRRALALAVVLTAGCLLGPLAQTASATVDQTPGSVVPINGTPTCTEGYSQGVSFSDNGDWEAFIGNGCYGVTGTAAFLRDLGTGSVSRVAPTATNVYGTAVDDAGDVVVAGLEGQAASARLYRRDGSVQALAQPEPQVPSSSGAGISDIHVSGDGQYVAFRTGARLVVADGDDTSTSVYVQDLVDGTYEYVTTGDDILHPLDLRALSADGRHLLVMADVAMDLADTNATTDAYVVDLQGGDPQWSVTAVTAGGTAYAGGPQSLSADGQAVLYRQLQPDRYVVWNRARDTRTEVGLDAAGAPTNAYQLALDGTGNYVVSNTNGFGPPSNSTQSGYAGWLLSDGTRLGLDTGGDLCDAKNQLLVTNLSTGWISLVTVSATGTPSRGDLGDFAYGCNGTSGLLGLSAGGQYVAFSSNRTNYVDPPYTTDVSNGNQTPLYYRYDRDRPRSPVALTSPTLQGVVAVGNDVTCDPGAWSPVDLVDLGYAWYVGGVVVPDAVATSYRVQLADSGKSLSCAVTGTNITGTRTVSTPAASVPVVTAPSSTSAPRVLGTVSLGSTVTCNPGTWAGSPAPDLFYDWLRAGTTGSVGTAQTYTLTTADAGLQLRCRVTANNVAGSAQATSAAVTLPTPPVDKKVPTVTSNQAPPRPGSVLTCGVGSWTGATSYAYRWLRNGVAVAAFGTTSTLTVQTADTGATFACAVQATNAGGSTVATSAALSVPAAPSNVTAPTLSWRNPLRAGTKLTTTAGTWSPTTPALTYAYQWTRDGIPITGATSSTYAVLASDVGHVLRSQVRASNTSGSSTFVPSSNAATP